MKKNVSVRKMTLFSKAIALLLVASMMIATVTGCGQQGGSNDINTSEEIAAAYVDGEFNAKAVTDGVKLTVAVKSHSKIVDYETNAMTKKIEEKFGVDLEFLVLPSSDYAAKLNVMVMNGEELPDIIIEPTGWESWAAEGVLVELSDYYNDENCSKYIHEGCERSGVDLISYMKRFDGSLYGIPKYNNEIFASVQQKMWVYQPWLNELGLQVPTTIEEYYEYCKLICEKDMNGNGKKDEIGVTGTNLDGWFDFLMSSFVYAHDQNWRLIKDGDISFAFTTDEWKEGLKYIKKFFDEGLIPDVTLTQDTNAYKAMLYADNVQLFSYVGDTYNGSSLTTRENYTVVPALEGPQGLKVSCSTPIVPHTGAVITTDCTNPLAAFLVLDYMCSEEISITQRFGEQGVDWDYWDDIKGELNEDEFVPSYDEVGIHFYAYDMINWWTSTEPQNVSWRRVGPEIGDPIVMNGYGLWAGSSDDEIAYLAELEARSVADALSCYEYQTKDVIDYAPFTLAEHKKWNEVETNILNYVKETTAKFLLGRQDIDDTWNSYVSELKNMDMEGYLEVLQTAYDRVH